MKRPFMLAWLALAALGACRRSPAPDSATLASSSAAPGSAAHGSAPPNKDFPADEPEPDAESALALGPSAPAAAPSERAERLRELLRGQLPAARLPLVETDPGVELTRKLYDRLTTEVTLRGLGDIGNVSATIAPPVLVSGKLDLEELSRLPIRMRSAFHSCYVRARDERPALEGKVSLLLVVDQQGAVSRVVIESAPPRSASLQDCLKERGRAEHFSSLAEGSQAKFRLQVAFKREEAPLKEW